MGLFSMIVSQNILAKVKGQSFPGLDSCHNFDPDLPVPEENAKDQATEGGREVGGHRAAVRQKEFKEFVLADRALFKNDIGRMFEVKFGYHPMEEEGDIRPHRPREEGKRCGSSHTRPFFHSGVFQSFS